MDDCLFCKIASGVIAAHKVYEDEHTVAFEDITPQAPSHVLVVPRRHIPSFAALSAEDGALLGHMAQAVNAVAAKKHLADNGYRVVCNVGHQAGQTVDHLHWHVLGGRVMHWPPG